MTSAMRVWLVMAVLLVSACKPTAAEVQRDLRMIRAMPERAERVVQYRKLITSVRDVGSAEEFAVAGELLAAILREPTEVDPAALDAIELMKIDGEFGELLCGEWVGRTLRDTKLRERYRVNRAAIRGCLALTAPAELDAVW